MEKLYKSLDPLHNIWGLRFVFSVFDFFTPKNNVEYLPKSVRYDSDFWIVSNTRYKMFNRKNKKQWE